MTVKAQIAVRLYSSSTKTPLCGLHRWLLFTKGHLLDYWSTAFTNIKRLKRCFYSTKPTSPFKLAFRSHKVTSGLTPTVQLEDVLCCGLHLLCMENENPWEMFTVGKRYNMWSQVSILTICISEMSRIHRKDTWDIQCTIYNGNYRDWNNNTSWELHSW